VVRTKRRKKTASTSKEMGKVVMGREYTRSVWNKTEQIYRENSAHSAMFELHPLPVYAEDLYQCRWRIVPQALRRLRAQSQWRRERGGASAAALRVCNVVVFDKDNPEVHIDGRP